MGIGLWSYARQMLNITWRTNCKDCGDKYCL